MTGPLQFDRTGEDVRVMHTTAWSDLESFEPDWSTILRENSDLTPFSSKEWLSSWWSAFRSDRPLLAFAFHSNDRLLGLAPFYFDTRSRFGINHPKVLRLVGAGTYDSDDLCPILRPDAQETCLKLMLQELSRRKDWDICSLETLPMHSRVGALLPKLLAQRGWPYQTMFPSNWCLTLPRTWEEYLARLAPDFRPLLTRYPKRLESRYTCTLSRCESEEDLLRYLPILFDLHQRRWTGAGHPGAFSSQERRHFYRRIASALFSRGWLDFWVLQLNQIPVALQFCCRYNDSVYLLQEGFDPAYSKDRVGYALRAKVLQHYIEAGMKRYDFMGGSDPYKEKFGADLGSYLTISFAKPRSLGCLYLLTKDAKQKSRRWLRERLPEAWTNRIRAWVSAGRGKPQV
jgi:CelD/BcsL family acetyltransferase involved in cellulose biosynthesis